FQKINHCMNVAIVGGSGFVGTKLLDILTTSGHTTSIINVDKAINTKYPSLSVEGNVLDVSRLTELRQGNDLVILLAAEHRYDVNVQGMRNTLQAMEANQVKRLIFTSSVAVYGLDKDNPDESFPADPFNHYGISKWQAEQVLQEWYKVHNDWNINIIRPTVIF